MIKNNLYFTNSDYTCENTNVFMTNVFKYKIIFGFSKAFVIVLKVTNEKKMHNCEKIRHLELICIFTSTERTFLCTSDIKKIKFKLQKLRT